MALTIFSSNRVETLQARLADRFSELPLADPFQCEQIVVPTFAMTRWLNIRLAQQHGVAANNDYSLPAKWIWQLAKSLLGGIPDQDPYSIENLSWSIFSQLPKLVESADFGSINRYLSDDASGVKQWQLAQRIAASFDRYLQYRPELIRQWSNGEDNRWQAILWRSIIADINQPSRAEMIASLIIELEQPGSISRLPERVSLFCISSLAPLYLEFINALSRVIEVNLYLHSPTDQYWADLVSQKKTAREQLNVQSYDNWYENRNELLASWGKQGQVFQDLLLENSDAHATDIELYSDPENKSLLNRIQQSIFDLNSDSHQVEIDDSIKFHICHSAMRECQVLQDQLLDMLDRDSELNPEDILVMVPDIATYAPFIEAVFRHQQENRLSCNISDVAIADDHPLVTTFVSLLRLPESRFLRSEILALLDNEYLCRKFEIDAQTLSDIRRLLDQSNVRWGIDAAHKSSLGLPDEAANTWQQASDRFFAGYAFESDEFWNGIAALSGWDEASTQASGHFWHFLDRLDSWRKRLSHAQTPRNWQLLLLQMLDEFFVEVDPRESRLQQLRDVINEFRVSSEAIISPTLMTHMLEQQLNLSQQSGGLYSGGITFCGMRPMRSIPFKVICLLGMNNADFPRREDKSDIELMSENPHPADPSKPVEDRYLMLETLLCARKKLYISYSGLSLKDNSHCQPSLFVQQLLDFIDSRFQQSKEEPLSRSLCQAHPMQVFSSRNFEHPDYSYNSQWFQVAQHLNSAEKPDALQWPAQPLLNNDTSGLLELEPLKRFLAHPIEFFFKQRLGIYLIKEFAEADDEVFDLNKLDEWQLKQQLAHDALGLVDASTDRVYAQGMLAHGHAAKSQLHQIASDQDGWLQALGAYRNIESKPLAVEFAIDGERIINGVIRGYYPGKGLMAYQSSKFKPKHLLGLWVDHLMLSAIDHYQTDDRCLLYCSNETWAIESIDAAEAAEMLDDYYQLYHQGCSLPLPIFPNTSYDWVKRGEREAAVTSAEKSWQSEWPGPDRSDKYIALAMRGVDQPPFQNPAFEKFAQRLFARLMQLSVKQ